MTFSHPSYFYLLFLLIPFLLIHLYVYKQNFESTPLFRNKERLSNKAYIKSIILGVLIQLAFVMLVVAATGPSWGKRYTQEERQYVDVVLAVDISRSMFHRDVHPTRLDFAASMVRSLLIEDSRVRYALVILKGGAYESVPMTLDRDAIRLASEALSPSMVSTIGTDLEKSLQGVPSVFPENMKTEKVVFLLSDGGEGISNRRNLCELFKNQKIVVHALSIGTESLEPLCDEEGIPIRYNGEPVTVAVEDEDLRVLAVETGGQFFQDNSGMLVSKMRQTLKNHINNTEGAAYVVHDRDDSFLWMIFALLCCFLHYLVRVFLWRKDI